METAKENSKYVLLKANKEKILSRLLVLETENFSVIFPLLFNDGQRCAAILNSKKLSGKFRATIEKEGSGEREMYWLQMDVAYVLTVQPLLVHLVSVPFFVGYKKEEQIFFEKLLKKLHRYYLKEKSNPMTSFYLNIFLQCLSEILIREKGFRFREEVLAKDFLKILQSEKGNGRQVQYYAEKLFVSRRYLTKAVHNTLGQPPKLFIDLHVICKAKKLLATRVTVYEIAEQLEFETSASFTVFFKRHTGNTPTEYRQKIINT